jgi:hypothetical protein
MGLLLLLIAIARLSPQEIAAVERDQEKARLAVDAKYGNRTLGELSADERRAQAKDLAEAQRTVLERHNVQAHEWALTKARQSRADQEAEKQAALALELAEQERAAAAALERARAVEERLVVVQRGVSEANFVILEEIDTGAVVLERGLPEDAKADQALAVEQDRAENLRGGNVKQMPGGAKPEGKPRGRRRH